MRFDYLHDPRPEALQRITEFRVPERLQNVVLAWFAVIAVLAGAYTMESYRLHAAMTLEKRYEERYAIVHTRVQRAHVQFNRVRALAALDRRIRAIAASGDADAATLAEMANLLPARAWLTGISRDGSGMLLEGRAPDLSVLADVLRRFTHAARLRHPTLVSAVLEPSERPAVSMSYAIHVDAVGP